jgi:DNA-binding IclR family transcriptional regulator
VLLSILPSAERTKLIAKLKLERVTTSTVTDRASLIADIQRCARRGYSETRGENVADVMAVAKTVRIEGDPYAIVVAGPMHRMTKQAAEHLKQLTAACTEITGTQ